MRLTRVPLSIWLPLGVILLCALLILTPISIPGLIPPTGELPTQIIYPTTPGLSVPRPSAPRPGGRKHFLPVLPRAIEERADEREIMIRTINMPGLLTEMLVSLPTTWPDSWHPENYSLFVWRSFAWPFYCLPFWWLVGRGLDCLFLQRPIPTLLVVVGSILALLFLLIAMGMLLNAVIPSDVHDPELFLGIWLWAILFAIVPIAWRRWLVQDSK
jgi:hypothetical protein